MNKKKLDLARKRIDKIDNLIFDLIKQRTKVVKVMMDIKNLRKQIIDQKRIKEILKKIRKKSITSGIDPSITKKIWTSMIWSYVEYQKKNFRKK